MLFSLIICTRNRVEKLKYCFRAIESAIHVTNVEIVIVNNCSTDNTASVIDEYKKKSRYDVKSVFCNEIGLGRARNHGVAASSGDVLLFTDDDCYIRFDYFIKMTSVFAENQYHYGGGQILLYDPADDRRCAVHEFSKLMLLPTTGLLPAGCMQGANMFFRRSVLENIGSFNEGMGAGTPFPCEDIEIGSRASRAGYIGISTPDLVVYHHHGRMRDSPEALQTIKSYDVGRGAYYASLIIEGVPGAWAFWMSTVFNSPNFMDLHNIVRRTAREVFAASRYCLWYFNRR